MTGDLERGQADFAGRRWAKAHKSTDACMTDLGALRRQLGKQMELLEAHMPGGARTHDQKAALRGLMPVFAMAPIPAAYLARIPYPWP
ncbi:hypothetical protein ACFW2Y_21165 [Streptomyces sp. NPDC058877]|uniref:hypothetical protein n=1 Tax=unclassified Streptomyces TaxID=2593676 RepID=UPI003692DD0D